MTTQRPTTHHPYLHNLPDEHTTYVTADPRLRPPRKRARPEPDQPCAQAPTEQAPATPQATASRERPRGYLYYLGVGISGGVFAVVALLFTLVIAVPAVTGSTPMTVLTSSMEPAYPPGTLVVVKPVDTDTLTRGDVITYQLESDKPDVVTHRIVNVLVSSNGTRAFITKGDNNDVADALAVQPVQIRGTVWYAIPGIGYINNVINGDARTWLIPLVAVGLFAYAGWQLVHWAITARSRAKARRRRDTTGSDEAALAATH